MAALLQPDMRQPGAGPRGWMKVKLRIAVEGRLGCAIRKHSSGAVALIQLHAMRIELVVLLQNGFTQPFALLRGVGRRAFASFHVAPHLRDLDPRTKSQRFKNRTSLPDALVGALYDLPPDRRSLLVV